MQYDKNYTNKKLQELENQSLPDLSKMDEHWQQMGLLLQPGVSAGLRRKNIFRRYMLVAFGVAAILIVSFFVYKNFQQTKENTPSTEISQKTIVTPGKLQAANDSPLLKARTSDGKDTTLKAIAVSEDKKSNKLLLEKFYEQLQKQSQRFQINNLRDTVLYGKEGTQLYIPAHSFDINGSVTVLVTEFYSIKDMIAQKLTTTCNGRQLITGGMIYLDARDKNDNLVDLKKGASLRLEMPKQDNQQPMELFYGYDYYRNHMTTVMDSINWNRTTQVFTDIKKKPSESFTIINSPKITKARDTINRRFDDEIEERTFDYTTKDTISGKPGITIKGDSIVLQKFGVDIKQLGWINCDRFYNDPRPRVELIVDLGDKSDNYNTMLVFDKFASLMQPSTKQGNTLRFINLPEGEPVRIISLGVKNGKPVTAMQQVTVSKATVSNMKFEEITASSFRKKLDIQE